MGDAQADQPPDGPTSERKKDAGPSAAMSRLGRFLQHPVAVGVAWVTAIVSIPLSFYFYYSPSQKRDLRYLVHPQRTAIVREGKLSRLSVTLDGKPFTQDVTAAVVAVWNEGNESIRPEQMLEPLVIRTIPPAPIIEATIAKTSRDVVRPTIDKSKFAQGEIGLGWSILEEGDGVDLQLTYAGGLDTKIKASATIEEQREIHETPINWAAQEYPRTRHNYKASLPGLAIIWGFFVGMLAIILGFEKWKGRRLDRSFAFWVLFPLLLVTALSLFGARPVVPPFGF
jgi:hypothetical protein